MQKIISILLFCLIIVVNFSLKGQSSTIALKSPSFGFESLWVRVNGDLIPKSESEVLVINDLNQEVIGLEIGNVNESLPFIRKLVFVRFGDTLFYEVETQSTTAMSLKQVDNIEHITPIAPAKDSSLMIQKMASLDFDEQEFSDEANVEPSDHFDNSLIELQATKKEKRREKKFSYHSAKNNKSTFRHNFCSAQLTSDDVRYVVGKLRGMVGFSTQLRMVNEILHDRCLYVDQLKSILKPLEEDNVKLQILKKHRNQILDPHRFRELASEFLLEENIMELEQIFDDI